MSKKTIWCNGTVLLEAVFLLEAFDTSGGIEYLLFARVERVTCRANIDAQFFDSCTGFKCIAAGTDNRAAMVYWMDVRFHDDPYDRRLFAIREENTKK